MFCKVLSVSDPTFNDNRFFLNFFSNATGWAGPKWPILHKNKNKYNIPIIILISFA